MTIDSGAVDTVGPPGMAPGIDLEETDASRNGRYYRAANGTKIAVHGMKRLRGCTDTGTPIGMEVQIADVKNTLASVARMCEAGNRVVFDPKGSYIEHLDTGARTEIEKGEDGYRIRMWVPKGDRISPGEEPKEGTCKTEELGRDQ